MVFFNIMFAESALPTLFEKYTQVSTTHARKYGGTGLGLAICKNLVSNVPSCELQCHEVNSCDLDHNPSGKFELESLRDIDRTSSRHAYRMCSCIALIWG